MAKTATTIGIELPEDLSDGYVDLRDAARAKATTLLPETIEGGFDIPGSAGNGGRLRAIAPKGERLVSERLAARR